MPSSLKALTPPQLMNFLEQYLNNEISNDYLKPTSLSEFTRKVLSAIREVEWGTVITYKELAEKIGKPTSVRAVANALGRNPFPFVIPCHRVIRSDTGLGGYAWGTELKEALINYEKHNPKPNINK